MLTADILTILSGFISEITSTALVIVPAVLVFGVSIWGLTFVIRKAYGYLRGL